MSSTAADLPAKHERTHIHMHVASHTFDQLPSSWLPKGLRHKCRTLCHIINLMQHSCALKCWLAATTALLAVLPRIGWVQHRSWVARSANCLHINTCVVHRFGRSGAGTYRRRQDTVGVDACMQLCAGARICLEQEMKEELLQTLGSCSSVADLFEFTHLKVIGLIWNNFCGAN